MSTVQVSLVKAMMCLPVFLYESNQPRILVHFDVLHHYQSAQRAAPV